MLITTMQTISLNDPLVQIALLILVLIIVWAILGFVSRVVRGILRAGCTLAILIVIILLLIRYFG